MAKPKKCKWCREVFEPRNSMQMVCGPRCAHMYSTTLRERKMRKDTLAMKRALLDTDRAHWLKKAQAAFNSYIRERDVGLPCISCGCPDGKGKRNAGHYRPAGVNTALRFDERNVHGQCERCNTYLSGNLLSYRDGLVKKIGILHTQWLDDNHDVKKWTIDELKAIEREYKQKRKEMQSAN